MKDNDDRKIYYEDDYDYSQTGAKPRKYDFYEEPDYPAYPGGKTPARGAGVICLVFGIFSIFLNFLCFFGMFFGVAISLFLCFIGLICGISAVGKGNRRGYVTAGIVINLAVVLLVFAVIIAAAMLFQIGYNASVDAAGIFSTDSFQDWFKNIANNIV